MNIAQSIIFTLFAVEFLAQFIASLNLWIKIDMLTVYLLAWQLFSMVVKWMWLQLLPPIVVIEQGSFCVATSLMAWTIHFLFIRYLPLKVNLFWLWSLSIIDT